MSTAFRRAVEARDLDAARELLADDAVLHSPVTHRPFEGREAVVFVLGHVAQVFEGFTYVDEMDRDAGNATMLRFTARIGDRQLEGVDLLLHDADGRVVDITVMVRPLSGLQALAEGMAARLGSG